jgi:hypothetical protein
MPLFRRPGAFCLATAAYFAGVLWLDRYVDERQQLLLGATTWAVLLLACRGLPPERLAQVALVVCVATCTEVVGSILWGVYEYRLGNLPAFVPPGHGLVYLTGLRLSECAFVRRRPRPFVLCVLGLSLAWTVAGLTVLPRLDVAGALGAVTFAACLLWGRAPAIYAGVFVAVAALEWYGTAVGTWRWAEAIPGLGIPDGNPPSGVASGYVLFDVIALALAPLLLKLLRQGQTRLRNLHSAPNRKRLSQTRSGSAAQPPVRVAEGWGSPATTDSGQPASAS